MEPWEKSKYILGKFPSLEHAHYNVHVSLMLNDYEEGRITEVEVIDKIIMFLTSSFETATNTILHMKNMRK